MQSRTPLVSIVVPSYQQAQYLERSIRSVLQQSYPNIECFVQDGGSTDDSVRILKKLQAEFPHRLHWISEKDEGQTDALNKGFQKISGDICGYLNSDDEYARDAFKQVIEIFRNNPQATWITGDCLIIDESGKEIQKFVRFYKKIMRFFLKRWLLLILNPIAQPATFWKKEALGMIGPFRKELRYCMDYDYWLRLWQKSGKPVLASNVLAKFRVHGQSKGGSQFAKQFAEEIEVAEEYSSNHFERWLHMLHAKVIVEVYRKLKNNK